MFIIELDQKHKGGTVQGLNFKKISVALCMVLMPVSAFAAGLGKLNVQSAIGEPLRAEIELISASPEELASISAAIAPEDAYAEQGIERPASHSGIKIEVAKNAAGTPVLKLKSSQPVSDPFLDMLIQLDWNSGRLLREYTVLLDPPGYKGESVPQAASGAARLPSGMAAGGNSGTASAPAANSSAKTSRIKKGVRQAKSRAKPAQNTEVATDSEPAAASAGEHLTQRGDTLSKIALEMKPDNVSLDQMLVGLYEANKEAFAGHNMNRLKVGQILKPPSEEALAAITHKQASQEIKMQTADWNAYRNKLADVVAKTTPNESVVDSQPTGGKIKTAAEDKSAAPASGPKDVVKLSSAAPSNGKGDADAKSAQAKITALQEEATAREKSLKEAQGRTADLEKQVADMKKLLELKNNSMAEMQKQAQQKATEPVAPTPASPAPTQVAEPTKPAEPVKPVEAAKPEMPAATTTPAAEPPANKPVVKRVLPPPPAPVEEPSFLSSLMSGDNMPLLAGGGGLLALLGGAWVYLRNKRKKNLADFEQGIMTSGGLKANTVFGNTSSTTSIDTGDTSFLTDFAQSANSGMIDTNDVDPIAEAEVYMAYGRDAQAEEILKDAIVKEPKRYELHLKLLEMYAASKNMSAFEAVSGELYTTLGADSPVWAKVAEIGVKLEPNNPLYQVTNMPATSESALASKLDASDFEDSRIASADDLNFSMDEVKGNGAPEPMLPEIDPVLDFTGMGSTPSETVPEVSDVNLPTIEPTVTMEMPMTSTSLDDGLDFDMSMLGEAEESVVDLPNLNFDTIQPIDKSSESLADMSMDVKPAFEDTMAGSTLVLGDAVEEEENNLQGFSFDIPTVNPESTEISPEVEANVLDLSGISLDIGEPEAASSNETSSVVTGPEPAEVDTKLELVTAYIEMEDKEGAKELLEEVMKEGGANQRMRAEELLKKIS
jgi:pilus assembly protein FimV